MLRRPTNVDELKPMTQIRLIKHIDSHGSGFLGRVPGSSDEFLVPVTSIVHVEASQAGLYQLLQNTCPGTFSDSFVNLAKASVGRGPLPLQDVMKALTEEAGKSGEVFEAFGIKFPVDQMTTWGVMVLVSVQLYLLVYLRQFRRTLQPSDASWDLPWIGMDRSVAAQAILLFTLIVVPVFASSVLSEVAIRSVVAAAEYHSRLHANTGFCMDRVTSGHLNIPAVERALREATTGRTVALSAGVLCSLILGVLCWIYRPKMNSVPPTVSVN